MKSAHLSHGIIFISALFLAGCGTLEKKTILLENGSSKELVLSAMGVPDDRQMNGTNEVWQYCQTGAGFGFHDYRMIWFRKGIVVGITSYKSTRAGTLCSSSIKEVRWEEAPDLKVEMRIR